MNYHTISFNEQRGDSVVVVIGRIRVDQRDLDRWRVVIDDLVAGSLAEPGCVSYTFSHDLRDPATFHISEEWETGDRLAAHLATDHFQLWKRALAEMTVHERVATVYEATARATTEERP